MEISFTERELDVMTVLWDLGPSTVAEVRAALRDELAYTTVLTMLRVLESKGHVTHEEEGRAHRYIALVQREDASRSALSRVVRKLFRGSPEQVLLQLVEERDLSDAQIRRMRDLLDEQLAKGGDE